MDLNTVWFILIAVLFIGYFFLEGFDYGVGILLPFLGKDVQAIKGHTLCPCQIYLASLGYIKDVAMKPVASRTRPLDTTLRQ